MPVEQLEKAVLARHECLKPAEHDEPFGTDEKTSRLSGKSPRLSRGTPRFTALRGTNTWRNRTGSDFLNLEARGASVCRVPGCRTRKSSDPIVKPLLYFRPRQSRPKVLS